MENNKDMVNHPDHYQTGNIECIDAIADAISELKGIEAFDTGNCIKYLWRWRKKNGVEDLKKTRWYLCDLIHRLDENDEIAKTVLSKNPLPPKDNNNEPPYRFETDNEGNSIIIFKDKDGNEIKIPYTPYLTPYIPPTVPPIPDTGKDWWNERVIITCDASSKNRDSSVTTTATNSEVKWIIDRYYNSDVE